MTGEGRKVPDKGCPHPGTFFLLPAPEVVSLSEGYRTCRVGLPLLSLSALRLASPWASPSPERPAPGCSSRPQPRRPLASTGSQPEGSPLADTCYLRSVVGSVAPLTTADAKRTFTWFFSSFELPTCLCLPGPLYPTYVDRPPTVVLLGSRPAHAEGRFKKGHTTHNLLKRITL